MREILSAVRQLWFAFRHLLRTCFRPRVRRKARAWRKVSSVYCYISDQVPIGLDEIRAQYDAMRIVVACQEAIAKEFRA